MPKITKTLVDRSLPKKSRYYLWDIAVPGFGIEVSKNTATLHSPVSFGGCDLNGDGDCWDEQAAVLGGVSVVAGVGAFRAGITLNIPLATTLGGVAVVAGAGSYVAGVIDGWE